MDMADGETDRARYPLRTQLRIAQMLAHVRPDALQVLAVGLVVRARPFGKRPQREGEQMRDCIGDPSRAGVIDLVHVASDVLDRPPEDRAAPAPSRDRDGGIAIDLRNDGAQMRPRYVEREALHRPRLDLERAGRIDTKERTGLDARDALVLGCDDTPFLLQGDEKGIVRGTQGDVRRVEGP